MRLPRPASARSSGGIAPPFVEASCTSRGRILLSGSVRYRTFAAYAAVQTSAVLRPRRAGSTRPRMCGGRVVAVDRQVRVGSGVDRGRSPTSPSGPTQTPWPRGGIVAWPPTHLGDLKPLAVGRQLPRSARSDFSVAISRALGMIVVTVHGALGAGTSPRLHSVLR